MTTYSGKKHEFIAAQAVDLLGTPRIQINIGTKVCFFLTFEEARKLRKQIKKAIKEAEQIADDEGFDL